MRAGNGLAAAELETFGALVGAGLPAEPVMDWSAPRPLPEGPPAVATFDPRLLPEAFRPWICDIAERMQCALDFPAVAIVVGCGAVIGRQVGIRPKRLDDWLVVPNLWGAVVGRPGLLKTPAMQEALRPLTSLEIAAKDEFEESERHYEAERRLSAEQQKVDAERARKRLKGGETREAILADLLAGSAEAAPPARRRYLVNDATVEKLGAILAENAKGVLCFRDELSGFLRGLDRDGREADRAFYLESWNGTGRFTYDRIGRGTLDIEAACLSILGSIQPGPLQDYLTAAAEGGAGDDGLLQRFQLTVWPDPSATWSNVDRMPDLGARDRVRSIFERLDRLSPAEIGAEEVEGGIPFLRFEPDAQELFTEWRTELEQRLRKGDLHPAFEAHLAKYRSLIPSLALIFHLVDHYEGVVSAASLLRAIGWGQYLESHARRLYDTVLRADDNAARALADRIQKGDLGSRFSLRDVYRPQWSGLTTRAAAQGAVDTLADLDWLAVQEEPTAGRRRTVYLVNPKLGAGGHS